MARPRKQTYTLDMYLKKNIKGDIDNNADVQRNFVWNNEQINELIVTVLTDDYIPPIILGEEDSSKLHIVDGGCRTVALIKFRYMNYKISSSIENSIIPYKKKVKDENENITYEDAAFDIKNKTYEKLPEELKEKFDEYQVETVIHEKCDSYKISRYIKRYNNHVAMNTNQKSFVYISNYASYIRQILKDDFFINCSNYTESERTKGVLERVVMESVMCMFHLCDWKKQAKQIASYLNSNSSKEEFAKFDDMLHRLEKVITDDVKDLFNSKDSFVWLTLFHKFTDLDIEDIKFVEFLKAFKAGLRNQKVNGKLFDTIDNFGSTKDKTIIIDKLNILETLMRDFLHIEKEVIEEVNVLDFTKENIKKDITKEDIEFYEDVLRDLTINVDNNSKLLNKRNHPSLIALVAYACENEIDLDDWIVHFFSMRNTYLHSQNENYIEMLHDLESYIKNNHSV